MKHDLFISYSRVDSAFALRLVGDLRSRGIETWLDQLDIPPGANWDNEIEKALDQAKIMIVVLSSVSAKSENVKNEIGAALERSKQIVPVMLAKGAVPLMINRLQREDFSGDYGPALEKLVHRLSGGSRTGSLRAISAGDVERLAKDAAARLQSGASREYGEEAGEPRSKASLKALLNEQLAKLDKNGDGILTPDELAGLHQESQPDSLAPITAARRQSGTAPKSRRFLFAALGLGTLAAGLVFAFGVQRAPDAAPLLPQPLAAPVQPQPLAAPVQLTAVVGETLAPNLVPQQPEVAAEVSSPARQRARPNPIRARVALAPGSAAVEPSPTTSTEQLPVTMLENSEPATAQRATGARGALLCREVGFGGFCQTLGKQPNLMDSEVGNDSVSSLALGTCRAVRVCTDINFGGVCVTFKKDQPDLSTTRVGAYNISSIVCVTPGASTGPATLDAPVTDPSASAPTEYGDTPSL